MKFTRRSASFLMAACLLTLVAAIFSRPAAAQDERWWIVRADYGTVSQHNDVTDLLRDLIARGGVNGRVTVNNQTMGGDPAVGANKKLRILARNARSEQREFDFREDSYVPADMFIVRRDDWDRGHDRDDHPHNYGGREQQESNGLQILRAFYGVQGRTVEVTGILRNLVRGDSLSFVVSNRALGGDPAIGADKVLIVIYRYQGAETGTSVREGNMLTLP
jgi:hypothetical protein